MNNDRCTNACKSSKCGDGIIQAGEQCDDNNNVSGDNCSASCKIENCVGTATGTGNACFSLNNPNCTITVVSAVAESEMPATGKPNLIFQHGFFNITVNCTNTNESVVVDLTLPGNVPVGSVYWKYGPTPTNSTPHWYNMSIDSDGSNLIKITLKDGGLGEDNVTAPDGVINDPGGIGFPPKPPQQVPSLGHVLLLLLFVLLPAIALRKLK